MHLAGPEESDSRLRAVIATQQAIAAAGELELDAALQLIAEQTQRLTGAAGAVVELVEEEEMVYRAASGSAAAHLGLRLQIAESLSGRSVRTGEVLICEDCELDERVDRKACRRVGARSMVVVPLHVEDRPVGVLKVLSPQPRAFGDVDVETLQLMLGLLALSLDRALKRETERELAELKDRFIAFAAHELRSPVAVIYGISETLASRGDQLDPARLDELRQLLYDQTARLKRLVEQVLDLSRLEAGAIRLEPRRLALRPELEHLAGLAAGGTRVEVEASPGLEADLDPEALEHIVCNLLVNALRHGQPPVRLRAMQEDRHLRITVEDSGPGIPAALEPKLFDAFSRADGTGVPGTGLGLAIARAYARAHGGDLLYDPVEGHGARFQFVLQTRTASD